MKGDGLRRRIVITGFMGAGKTTVAEALARRLGCAWTDLDAVILAREGRTPQELIDEGGEEAFRATETRALTEVLERGEARVVALGGGAWTRADNRALVAAHDCLSVWLDAPFELCWQRTKMDGDTRPLARSAAEAARLYDERRSLYALASRRVAVSAGRSVEELAAAIESCLTKERAEGV